MIDYERLESRLAEDRETYLQAQPFPHIVVDDLLLPEVFDEACREFGEIDEATWTAYLHVNERKYAHTRPEEWGPTLQTIASHFTSVRFITWLEQVSGFDGLLADWGMDGGGLHQSFRGGHLNLHADFTSHHTNHHWRRRINVLFYLNERWSPDWGGALELWDADRTECVERVEPIGNRLLVFTTDADSYHGHPDPMTCPEGVGRRSLALYYFQEEADPLTQATDYRPRPDDSSFAAAKIYLDKRVLGTYDTAKRWFGLSDDFASNALVKVSHMMRRLRRRA